MNRLLAAVLALCLLTSVAAGQSGGTMNPMMMGSIGSPSISFRTSSNAATGASTYTFPSQGIGTPDQTRRVIVGVTQTSALSISSITSASIGGVAADIDVQIQGATRTSAAIISALVPTGTTATIIINFSTNTSAVQIGVWAAYNLLSGTPTATATATTGASGETLSMNLNVTNGGVIASSVADNGDGALTTLTWTGTTTPAGDYSLISGVGGTGGASYTATATQSPRTFSATWVTSSRGAGAAASFR